MAVSPAWELRIPQKREVRSSSGPQEGKDRGRPGTRSAQGPGKRELRKMDSTYNSFSIPRYPGSGPGAQQPPRTPRAARAGESRRDPTPTRAARAELTAAGFAEGGGAGRGGVWAERGGARLVAEAPLSGVVGALACGGEGFGVCWDRLVCCQFVRPFPFHVSCEY